MYAQIMTSAVVACGTGSVVLQQKASEYQGGSAVNALGKAVLRFEECQLVGNSFDKHGGALFIRGLISLAMNRCAFLANKVGGGVIGLAHHTGGAAYIFGVTSVTITNCSFSRNEAVRLHFA